MSENKSQKWSQFLAAICVCIGAMGTGTVIGWTANISTGLESGELNDVKLDLSSVGSVMCLGAMIMCIPIGTIADIIGRKYTVLLTVIPFVFGWVLIIFTQNLAMVLVGRFLTGMAGGSFCITAPLYTSEIAETQIRGTLGTFLQLFITIGILYSYIFGYIASVKFFCYLCVAVPIVFGIVFIFHPETPVWLITKDKKERALSAFKRLRGKNYDPAAEISAIQEQKAKQEELKGKFWVELKTKQGKKSSIICFTLMFYQQLSGINAVMFYSGLIFKDANSSIDPAICTIIIGVVQVIATVFSAWLVEKLGRKILLMTSDGFMALSTLLLGIYFMLRERQFMDEEAIHKLGWLPLMSLVVFIIAFSIGMGPIPWLASSEIFPPAIMAKMGSLAGAFNWFLAFVVTVGYGPLKNLTGGDIVFFIFTAVSASGVFFVWIVMPETKGKSFAEIQEELGK